MPAPSAPVITSVTLVPDEAAEGTPIAVSVEWSGFPVEGVTYQWRRGTRAIKDATGPTYPLVGSDLNCLVHIDNGRGTASSASGYATVAEPDTGPLAFSAGFSGGFQ